MPERRLEDGPTRLVVNDLFGREAAVLASGSRGPGAYNASFDAGTLATGIYIVVLESPSERVSAFLQVIR